MIRGVRSTARFKPRTKSPIALSGRTLVHLSSDSFVRLDAVTARSIGEALINLGSLKQCATRGWFIRVVNRHIELDGRTFAFPVVRLTRNQAVNLAHQLVLTGRLRSVA